MANIFDDIRNSIGGLANTVTSNIGLAVKNPGQFAYGLGLGLDQAAKPLNQVVTPITKTLYNNTPIGQTLTGIGKQAIQTGQIARSRPLTPYNALKTLGSTGLTISQGLAPAFIPETVANTLRDYTPAQKLGVNTPLGRLDVPGAIAFTGGLISPLGKAQEGEQALSKFGQFIEKADQGTNFLRSNLSDIVNKARAIVHGNGNVINADSLRELFKPAGYNRINSADFHESSSALSKFLTNEAINNLNPGDHFLFTAGGSGSGKTALGNLLESGDFKAVLDGNFSSKTALSQVGQVIQKGAEPTLAFVYRDPVQAYFDGVVRRAVNPDNGRVVPIKVAVDNYFNAIQNVKNAIKKYGSDVNLMVIDNSGAKNAEHVIPNGLEFLDSLNYNKANVTKQLIQGTIEKIQNGQIPESVGKALLGDLQSSSKIKSSFLPGQVTSNPLTNNPLTLPQGGKILGKEPTIKLKSQLSGIGDQLPPQTPISSSIPSIDLPGKERGFVTTVKTTPTAFPEVKAKIEGNYTPITNVETLDHARNYIKNVGLDVAKNTVENSPLTAQTNLIGQELARQAQSSGRFDEATSILENLAKKGTESGQAIQAFSVWSRLSPEGMLNYAMKQIKNANESQGFLTKAVKKVLNQGPTKLNEEDVATIKNLMKAANTETDLTKQAELIRQVWTTIGKKLPWGVSDIVDEYRYNNMLSNPLTHLRNIWSNLLQTYATRPATLAAQGKLTDAVKYEVGTVKALPNAFQAFKEAFNPNTRFGKLDVQESLNLGPIKPQRLGTLFNVPSHALEGADKFFQTLIRSGEMALGKNEAEANKIATYSLFRTDLHPEGQGILLNKIDDVSKAMYGLRRVGLGWFIPFIRTPMNVAKQWIEYSPAGFATLPGSANKKEQIAKALLGSMATAIGADLALQGKTTWQVPTDPTAKKLFYDSGRKPYSVKIGNNWVPMQTMGVFAWALGLPAAIKYYQEEVPTALTDPQIDKLTNIAASGLGFWSNQTFVSGLGGFVQLAQGNTDFTLPKNIGYAVGQLKPWDGLLRYVANVVDPVFRQPQGIGQQLLSDIPFATKTLPAYPTSTGQPAIRNITNYIAPYAQGIANPQFEPYYQQRQQQLQIGQLSNAVSNGQLTLPQAQKIVASQGPGFGMGQTLPAKPSKPPTSQQINAKTFKSQFPKAKRGRKTTVRIPKAKRPKTLKLGTRVKIKTAKVKKFKLPKLAKLGV